MHSSSVSIAVIRWSPAVPFPPPFSCGSRPRPSRRGPFTSLLGLSNFKTILSSCSPTDGTLIFETERFPPFPFQEQHPPSLLSRVVPVFPFVRLSMAKLSCLLLGKGSIPLPRGPRFPKCPFQVATSKQSLPRHGDFSVNHPLFSEFGVPARPENGPRVSLEPRECYYI